MIFMVVWWREKKGGNQEHNHFFFTKVSLVSHSKSTPTANSMKRVFCGNMNKNKKVAYPPLNINLDTESGRTLAAQLTFTCNPHARGDGTQWLSPKGGYRGTAKLRAESLPLRMTYIAPDKSSITVRVSDPQLRAVLESMDRAIKDAAGEDTTDLLSVHESGQYAPTFKLKQVRFAEWVDQDGNKIDVDTALSSKGTLLKWVISPYQITTYGARKYVLMKLIGAKVQLDTPDDNKDNTHDDDDIDTLSFLQ
jgi:hypothetical protein